MAIRKNALLLISLLIVAIVLFKFRIFDIKTSENFDIREHSSKLMYVKYLELFREELVLTNDYFTMYDLGMNCSFKWERDHFLIDDNQCKLITNKEAKLITDPNNQITAPVTSEEYEIEVIANNLSMPWSTGFLPGGSILISEVLGRILLINKSNLDNSKLEKRELWRKEGNLFLGLAVDPDFSITKNIFVYNIYPNTIDSSSYLDYKIRIIQLTLSENLTVVEEKTVLDDISMGKFHRGGRIKFGPDGKLYITTGDADPNSITAQDIRTLNGAILRINKDGTIPIDNPFNNGIYSYGHRNPQGIDWNPKTLDLYETEHGDDRMDELNVIKAGKNYGWPIWECDQKKNIENIKEQIDFIKTENPRLCYYNEKYKNKSNYYTIAPSGISFVSNLNHPWYGNLFIGALRGGHIQRIFLDNNGDVVGNEIFLMGFGRIRDIVFNEKDGKLYVLTSNSDVLRKGEFLETTDILLTIKPII